MSLSSVEHFDLVTMKSKKFNKFSERDFIIAIPEWQTSKESGEHVTTEPNGGDESVYSTLSDGDSKQMCRVKMVKVTNVYKVAYLRHYIKQKRLRRASKQAVLRKKVRISYCTIQLYFGGD